MRTEYVEFKLYLEGIVTEFIEVIINEDASRPTSVSVRVPANTKAMDVLPCTTAHLFYRLDKEFVLIFEGELASKRYQKTGVSRSIELNFLGITNNLNRVFKKSVASLNMGTYNNANFLLIDSDNPDEIFKFVSNETSQESAGAFNNAIMFQQAFNKIKNYYDEDTGEPKTGYENALIEAVKIIFDEAQKASPWYGYFYNAFKIDERILAFKNKMIATSLFKKAQESLFKTSVNSLPNIASLTQLLYNFIEHFGHKLIHMSAPLGTKKSIVLMPNSDYLTPIKCNMFFSDNVETASFAYDSLADPTRMSVSTESLVFAAGDSNTLSMTPTYFAPGPAVSKETLDETSGNIDLTEEEQYRGILPAFEALTGLDSAYANLGRKRASDENIPPTQEERNGLSEDPVAYLKDGHRGEVTSFAARAVVKRYWDKRYIARSFTLVTNYSPFRLPGFVGIFIDSELPSVIGTISSIQTTISSEGRVLSTVLLNKPRMTWDWNIEGKGLESADITPALEQWYEHEVYSVDNIGKEVYNVILGHDSDKDISSIFKYSDYTEQAGIDLQLAAGANTEVARILRTPDDYFYTTVKLSEQVAALKYHYFNLPQDQRHAFEKNEVQRDLMTEEEYWTFLLGDIEGASKINDEGEFIPENIVQDKIYRDLDNQDDVISIKKDTYETYKPFVKKRRIPVEDMQ